MGGEAIAYLVFFILGLFALTCTIPRRHDVWVLWLAFVALPGLALSAAYIAPLIHFNFGMMMGVWLFIGYALVFSFLLAGRALTLTVELRGASRARVRATQVATLALAFLVASIPLLLNAWEN